MQTMAAKQTDDSYNDWNNPNMKQTKDNLNYYHVCLL